MFVHVAWPGLTNSYSTRFPPSTVVSLTTLNASSSERQLLAAHGAVPFCFTLLARFGSARAGGAAVCRTKTERHAAKANPCVVILTRCQLGPGRASNFWLLQTCLLGATSSRQGVTSPSERVPAQPNRMWPGVPSGGSAARARSIFHDGHEINTL